MRQIPTLSALVERLQSDGHKGILFGKVTIKLLFYDILLFLVDLRTKQAWLNHVLTGCELGYEGVILWCLFRFLLSLWVYVDFIKAEC